MKLGGQNTSTSSVELRVIAQPNGLKAHKTIDSPVKKERDAMGCEFANFTKGNVASILDGRKATQQGCYSKD